MAAIEPKVSLVNGYTNGNGDALHNVDTGAHSQDYQGSGGPVRRFLTPGGNPIDTSQASSRP